MEKEKIAISTLPISVKIVEVGGKKLTISVFNQIPSFGFPSQSPEEIIHLGWVRYKDEKYLLYANKGILKKHRVIIREVEDWDDFYEKKRYRGYGGYDGEEESLREEYDEKKLKREEDIKKYTPLLQYENQIYIGI